MEAIKGRIYKHKKGGIYRVLDVAKHSETLEEMVIYYSLTYETLWVRPKKMFEEPGRFKLLDVASELEINSK